MLHITTAKKEVGCHTVPQWFKIRRLQHSVLPPQTLFLLQENVLILFSTCKNEMDLKWQKTWCWSLAGWIIYPSSQTPGVRVLALGVQEISITCPMFSMNYVMNLGQMKWTICWSPVFSFPMIILHLMPPCTIRKGEVSKAWGDAMTHSFFSCYCNYNSLRDGILR